MLLYVQIVFHENILRVVISNCLLACLLGEEALEQEGHLVWTHFVKKVRHTIGTRFSVYVVMH